MTTTQVEEYTSEVPVSEIAQLAEDGETAMLLDSLGLEGQKKLYKSDDCGEEIKPHPYRVITAEELVVFKACFPNTCNVKDYKEGPIPLRVLQIISHVRGLEHKDMKYIEVWYPKPGVADPVIVARPSYWNDPIYVLARWGTGLLSFDKLRDKAVSIICDRTRVELNKGKQAIEQAQLNLKATVLACLTDGRTYSPTISVD